MLRSFDYAAFHPLVTDSNGDEAGAVTWTARARTAFLDGYWRAVNGAGYLPPDPASLLRGFELEKALYEVRLEAAYRPDWLPIPIGGVKRLVDDKLSEPTQD
jgi:maltokinase